MEEKQKEEKKEWEEKTKNRLEEIKEQYESKLERHLAFTDQLVADKKALSDQLESVFMEKVD
jgi:exonuclease I